MATLQTDIVPQGWTSATTLLVRDGATIAVLKRSTWGRKTTLSIGGRDYLLQATGGMQRAFEMTNSTQQDTVVARARSLSFFSSALLITQPEPFVLKPASMMQRGFVLLNNDQQTNAQQVGSITPNGWFTNKATAKLPDAMSLEVQAFLIWLVLTVWQRNNSAAAVST